MSRRTTKRSRRRKHTSQARRQVLNMEQLETRVLMAADFPMGPGPVEPVELTDGLMAAPLDATMVVAPADEPVRLAPPQDGPPAPPPPPGESAAEYSIDGWGNNAENPEWGSTGEQLLRLTTVEYADGISEPAGEDRPSARVVSNTVAAQDESVVNDRYLTDLTWVWGQFIDHDIDLTHNITDEEGYPLESFPIEVPAGDPFFDPFGTGEVTIDLYRSAYDATTGDSVDDPRAQVNAITAFIDGSVIYGADEERAAELRTFEGGKLKTSEGDLLPFNEAGLDNAGGPSASLFLAGDVRANENAALTAMQTLWVREHNYWADQIAAETPGLSDEEIFQEARSIVTAEMQAITYNQFLPALLGYGAIDAYQGYDPNVNPGIANVFSTAAYRFGHSMLSSELLRLSADGTVADEGNLSLSDAFFAPDEITDNGIDSILLGAASQQAQEIDNLVVDDVRNFLFGPPGAGGFDLASLNIQRGRDHGLADYNQTRVDFGLAPVESFADITSNPELAADLEALYGDVDNIDVWVGGLAEDHVPGSSMGELFGTIIADQFERIRDGDANWYQNVLAGPQLAQVEGTTLADVIERNTGITDLRENVFLDESVLYYHAEGRREPVDVDVVVRDARVDLIDHRSGELLASRDVNDVSQVQVVGNVGLVRSIAGPGEDGIDIVTQPGTRVVAVDDARPQRRDRRDGGTPNARPPRGADEGLVNARPDRQLRVLDEAFAQIGDGQRDPLQDLV